ncbi:MAG: hypothetical protein AYL33_007870 [Candidatus Bathyarchaeota archaeon B63]|nr:MAG: hypothetical protein AYL33_007870 [Candidatus Bathyarchaeota archaeon B63]
MNGHMPDELLSGLAEFKASGPLKAGLSSVSISPDWPVTLPYGKQIPTTEFYNRNIFCKALALQVKDLRVIIVSMDIIGLRKSTADAIKRRIEEETGVPSDFIILAATHNHSYPRISDVKVRELIHDGAVKAAKEAIGSMFEASIGFKVKRLPRWLTLNRSKVNGKTDTTAFVAKIADSSGATRGVLFSFPAHPNIFTTAWGGGKLGKIGPEWPEYARKWIETHIDVEQMFTLYPDIEYRDVTVMFLLGAAGDLNPNTRRNVYRGRPVGGKRAFVEALGDGILRVLRDIKTESQVEMVFKWAAASLPVRERWSSRLGKTYPALLQALLINDACIVAVPGEATVDLGIEFRRKSGVPCPALVTCANDALGYFVSEVEGLENATYEAQGSPLTASRGRLLVDAAVSLVNPMHKPSKPVDPEREMGRIRGTLRYRGRGRVTVGLKRQYAPPSYGDPPAAPFMGKRVKPDEAGGFLLEPVMPGTAFVYVDEVISEGERPIILMWGKPVEVRAGADTEVSIELPDGVSDLIIEAREAGLEITDLRAEGSDIEGIIEARGRISGRLKAIPVRGWAYDPPPMKPIAEVTVDEEGRFTFKNMRPGEYGLLFWMDINGNGRPERGVDVVAPQRLVKIEARRS